MSISQVCLREAAGLDVRRGEPLLSTRREDGLWESIETDDNHASANQPNGTPTTTVHSSQRAQVSNKSVGIQTSPEPLSAPTSSTPTDLIENPRTTTQITTTTDQRVPSSTASRPAVTNSQESLTGEPITPTVTRRRRGRPRKTPTGFRNPRRSVRFSDPLSFEDDEHSSTPSRDSHVFVRLLNVVIQQPEHQAIETGTATTQEYSWNNRGKGWREADKRSDEGLVQIVSLFDTFLDIGVDVFPVVLPTERGGVGQSVKMIWNRDRACFVGSGQDGEVLSIALGEMKDMARDPWARQFVGYVMR